MARNNLKATYRCFRIAGVDHLVCASRTESRSVREDLHELFQLREAPLFLPECALPWAGESHARSTGKPVTPHEGCGRRPTWWKGGQETKEVFVRGLYEYKHYMQDNFNDDGWGCAYR